MVFKADAARNEARMYACVEESGQSDRHTLVLDAIFLKRIFLASFNYEHVNILLFHFGRTLSVYISGVLISIYSMLVGFKYYTLSYVRKSD